MAFVPKARDFPGSPLVGASIRIAQRETFDRRKAMHPPSATGGAPTQNLDKGTPTMPELKPVPLTPADQYRENQRTFVPNQPILPFLLAGKRSVDEYAQLSPGFAEKMAQDFQDSGIATDHMDAMDLAKRTVAALNRWTDPRSSSTGLPDQLYASQNARRVAQILDTIRSRRAIR